MSLEHTDDTETEFRVTEAAARRIRDMVAASDTPALGLRVGVRGGGCAGYSYVIELAPDDALREGDAVFERDGAKVLVNRRALEMMVGAELDWVSSLMGASFRITNPKARRACGCGTSFARY